MSLILSLSVSLFVLFHRFVSVSFLVSVHAFVCLSVCVFVCLFRANFLIFFLDYKAAGVRKNVVRMNTDVLM